MSCRILNALQTLIHLILWWGDIITAPVLQRWELRHRNFVASQFPSQIKIQAVELRVCIFNHDAVVFYVKLLPHSSSRLSCAFVRHHERKLMAFVFCYVILKECTRNMALSIPSGKNWPLDHWLSAISDVVRSTLKLFFWGLDTRNTAF